MSDPTEDQKRRGRQLGDAMITRQGPTEMVIGLDAADAEHGIRRIKVDDAREKITALLTLPNMGDRVNGDPMFILGWEAACEEVTARLPEILAVLTETEA